MDVTALQGATIVVTGVTGQVAEPLAVALAADNTVYGAARFSDSAARQRLEAAGVRCVPVDLASGDLDALPADADYVLNLAVTKSNDWDADLLANCGGVASLMEHHQGARAFLHCSSTAVYKPMGHHVFAEGDPLGDNHAVWPFLRTYSICKIAAEGTAQLGGAALQPAHHHHQAVGPLRRPGRVARRAPPHDAHRVGRPCAQSTPPASTTRCTSTTSPACCRRSWRPLRCPPPSSTGAARWR